MNVLHTFTVIIVVLTLSACSSLNSSQNNDSDYQATEALYQSAIASNPANESLLNLFLTQMPKGADLHHHYSGTIYAETYLDWIKRKGWFINPCTSRILTVTKPPKLKQCDKQAMTVDQLLGDSAAYRQLLMLWSDKDFDNHYHEQVPPDANFFNTFGYFGPVSDEYQSIGLNIIKQRAIAENVSYIETMLSRVGVKASQYFDETESDKLIKQLRNSRSQKAVDAILDSISEKLLNSQQFQQALSDFVSTVEKDHQGIDDDKFTMRYQSYAVRVFDPLQVFLDLFSGYLATEQSPLFVGVNIVAPENNQTALDDYTLHMRMYNYLQRKYPSVGRALHAGELTLGMVRPKDLLFHIEQARDIAKAQRIGHGIDLPYESNPIKLLEDLKQSAVVEINLTSNEFILGVKGNAHPYKIYSEYGVPMIISTDDSGVSRNNLTNEFVLLATRYRPSYQQIKEYVYNSIRYSFLQPSEKSEIINDLDIRFAKFERKMAALFNH